MDGTKHEQLTFQDYVYYELLWNVPFLSDNLLKNQWCFLTLNKLRVSFYLQIQNQLEIIKTGFVTSERLFMLHKTVSKDFPLWTPVNLCEILWKIYLILLFL